LVLAASCALSVAAPIVGTYETPDVLDGRWTLASDDATVDPVGDLLDAQSYDGADLGTQWVLSGAVVDSDSVIDMDDLGDGTMRQVFKTVYTGGTLSLKSGIWTEAGDGDYAVDLTTFIQTTEVFMVDGEVLTATGQITAIGDFTDHAGYQLRYLNGISTFEGSSEVAPVGYPSYLGAEGGIYGTVSDIKLEIVPEPATMSLLGLGGLLVLRRRRR
ncbi:MAG: PEP-CTERM sorting domain-containing protein, partial [Planctomycetota bacterium]